MLSPDYCQVFARYNRWMNDKVFVASACLTDAERKRDRGAFFKSIHGTLNHILLADRVWMGRFTGATLPEGELGRGGIRALDQELYSDFAELRRERSAMDDEIEQWFASMTSEALAGTLKYARSGKSVESPLWSAVAHFFNHQTHHRGQVTTLLMQLGQDPGATDLVAMLREEAGAHVRECAAKLMTTS